MSAIDIQNAKQIRDPMDVLITLSLGTDIAMTYSGYSSAKVADGVLNQSSWPMRGLADLQGNGFPLDGSRVLYNPNTSPSQTNGKLGVRGNVGQPVSVTATGNDTIAALAISVTGAASVTLNGETTEITGSHVTLQLLNTTAALTFQPSSEDRRVEIITALPEADFVINNDNLIKATVSLRSDLSIIDPTLPESELNVEVYQDLDISEAVASIPEDTPITYQAGYPGDMSPVRKFYVSGQVTWEDNVLKIQAVDAVHFLEAPITSAIYMSGTEYAYDLLWHLIENVAGVAVTDGSPGRVMYADIGSIVVNKMSIREIVTEVMHWFKLTSYSPPQIPCYVDAGIPTLRMTPPRSTYRVLEDDCTSVKVNVDRTHESARLFWKSVETSDNWFNEDVGTFRWVKNGGAFIELEDKVMNFSPSFRNDDFKNLAYSTSGAYEVLPSNSQGSIDAISYAVPHGGFIIWLYDADSNQGAYKTIDGGTVYTQVVPWSARVDAIWPDCTTQAEFWRKRLVGDDNIPSDQTEVNGILRGRRARGEDREKEIALQEGKGSKITVQIDKIEGQANRYGKITFPDAGVVSHFSQSPITCSFTWKGDPRIQPRDVFTFHRLDGTDEEWTFENITITHEGGGTSAEITARKGIV